MPLEQLEKWQKLGRNFEADKALICLEDWASICVNPHFRVSSIEQVFDNNTPSLATLTKYNDERTTAAILTALILHTASFFKVGGKLSKNEALETALLIIDNYNYLTIADFKLCFQWGKAGRFGKCYDRFDGANILEWLSLYNEQREAAAEAKQFLEHHNKKALEKTEWSRAGIEQMKQIFSKFKTVSEPKTQPSFKSAEEIEQERSRQIEKYKHLFKDHHKK